MYSYYECLNVFSQFWEHLRINIPNVHSCVHEVQSSKLGAEKLDPGFHYFRVGKQCVTATEDCSFKLVAVRSDAYVRFMKPVTHTTSRGFLARRVAVEVLRLFKTILNCSS